MVPAPTTRTNHDFRYLPATLGLQTTIGFVVDETGDQEADPSHHLQGAKRRHQHSSSPLDENTWTFKSALESGKSSIPSVVIPTEIRKWTERHGARPIWLVALLIVASWPFIVNVILKVLRPSLSISHHYANFWLASFGLINALMLFAAYTAWNYISAHGDAIDDVLSSSPQKDLPAAWMLRWLQPSRQLLLPYIGLLSAPLALAVIHHAVRQKLAVGAASYLMAGWTGFIGGSVLYWLWVVPETPRQLYRAGDLKMTWLDPSSTPALRGIARALGIASLFILAGVLSISILGLVLPDLISDHATQTIVNTFFVVSALTTIRVAIYPMPWYYMIIDGEKTRIKKHLLGDIPDLDDYRGADDQAIDLFQKVSATRDFPFSTGTFVQYGAALLGAIVALVVNAFFHH